MQIRRVFAALLDDIRFLTAGVKFILDMQAKGFEMCRPQICPVKDRVCELEQVYNPMLAMRGVEKTVVSNRFELDENGRFYLVTGPNHGGKSIFAYSIGMAQALCQLGLFVPAHQAKMSPVTGIFTHFPVSDENNYGKGRLESECARLSEILKQLSDTDMLLMDESFSSTSGLEAGYIASEVLTGIGVIGCCGLFVTHIHDLPMKVQEYNSYPGNRSKIDNLVAQMDNVAQGVRSYRISRTTPDGLSYARDIAARYGLNLEEICGNKEGNVGYVDFTSLFACIKMKKNGASGEYCQDIRCSKYRKIVYFKTDDLHLNEKHEEENIMINAAFIYVAPDQNPQEQKAVIPSETLTLHVVGCSTYEQAEAAAKELVANGCGAIELCAGFGNEGIARIKKAVGPEIPVGAVKFDYHPAFGFKSGDELFQ